MDAHELVECGLCHRRVPCAQAKPAEMLRGPIAALIRARYPEWEPVGFVCRRELDRYLSESMRQVLEDEHGEWSKAESRVIEAMREQEILSIEPPPDDPAQLPSKHRMADRIARFGGCWFFLGIFGAVMVVWTAVNSVGLFTQPFDPYPYIRLNLGLSCVAAVQAPVILMSQNRDSERDRERAWNDCRVNLKAELEVRLLSEKVGRLQLHQWQRRMEIQHI